MDYWREEVLNLQTYQFVISLIFSFHILSQYYQLIRLIHLAKIICFINVTIVCSPLIITQYDMYEFELVFIIEAYV